MPPALQAGGRRFEPCTAHHSPLEFAHKPRLGNFAPSNLLYVFRLGSPPCRVAQPKIEAPVATRAPIWGEVECSKHVPLNDPARPLPIDLVATTVRASTNGSSKGAQSW